MSKLQNIISDSLVYTISTIDYTDENSHDDLTITSDNNDSFIENSHDLSFNINKPSMTSTPSSKNNLKKQRPLKSLRILTINFQSVRNKGLHLEETIDATDPDVIIGTETLLDDNVASSEFLPNRLGYDVWRRDREDSNGGLLIAARKEMQLCDVWRSTNVELMTATLKLITGKKIGIAAYYRPPNKTNDEYVDQTKDEFGNFCTKYGKSPVFIGGDFNLPDIDWSTQSIVGHQYPKKMNQSFLDTIAANSLEQQVDFPTRKNSTLDLLLTTHSSFKIRCKPILAIGNADHDIVLYDTSTTDNRPKPLSRIIKLWKKANLEGIKLKIKAFDYKNYTNVHLMWGALKESIHQATKEYVPEKRIPARTSHPWMNTKLRRMIRRKQKAHKKQESLEKKKMLKDTKICKKKYEKS